MFAACEQFIILTNQRNFGNYFGKTAKAKISPGACHFRTPENSPVGRHVCRLALKKILIITDLGEAPIQAP